MSVVRYRYLVLGVGVWVLLLILGAGKLDFWGDEIGSLKGAAEPLSRIAHGRGSDFHPPVYFLLLHWWIGIFGLSEVAVRSLSVIIGGACILFTAVLAKRQGVRRPWIAALLLGFSPFWMLFCGMARYYSITALVYVGVLLLFTSVIRSRSFLLWGVLGAAVAVAGYTNYLMLAGVVVFQAVIVIRKRERVVFARWLFSLAVASILVSPMAALALGQTKGMFLWGESASFAGFGRTVVMSIAYPVYVLAASETVQPWQFWISVPLLGASLFLVQSARRSRFSIIALLTGICVGTVVVTTVARSLPIVYLPSRMLFLAPVWAIVLSVGMEKAGRAGWIALAVLAIGYGVGCWNLGHGREFHNTTYLIPWEDVARTMLDDPEPDKSIVTTEEYPLFHYGKGLRFQLARPGESAADELARKWVKVVWLVQRDRADRQRGGLTRRVETWLNANYRKENTHMFVPLSRREIQARELLLGREPAPAALTLTRFVRPW